MSKLATSSPSSTGSRSGTSGRPGGESGRSGARRSHRTRSTRTSIALHATLSAACAIALFPVLWVLLSSFKPADRIRSSEITLVDSPTLENYSSLLTDTDFLRWFVNSVIVAGFTTILGVFVAASAGYALSRFNFPGRRGLMWTFLVTQMFPVAVLIVPIYTIMSNIGLINTRTSLVLAYLTVAVPFCAWMMRGYFNTIPRDIDEAGALDGLGPFATFWRLVIPLSRPGLAVTGFYSFLTAWGEVAYASAFIQTSDKYTLAYGLQSFIPQYNPRWELLTPAAILITIPAALVFLYAQRHLVQGLSAGATKG